MSKKLKSEERTKRSSVTAVRTKLAVALIAFLLVSASAAAVSAASSLLKPESGRISAGSSYSFTLDLSSVLEEAEDEGGVLKDFDVSLSISPSISSMSVREGVGSVNAVSGTYDVSSSQLGKNEKLNFTVKTPSDITSETTYTVSVSVTGYVKDSDSFTFIVAPVKKEEPADKPKSTDKKMQGMPKKGGFSGSVSKGGSGGSTASVVYAGSWDNYLDALSVDGFEFTRKFNKIRDTYFLTVPLDVTDLTVNATASDSSAIVAVTGNSGLPEGRSKIMINVTADDGSVRVYRIYVDRTDEQKDGQTDEDSNMEV